jgi:hypothetical protein
MARANKACKRLHGQELMSLETVQVHVEVQDYVQVQVHVGEPQLRPGAELHERNQSCPGRTPLQAYQMDLIPG